MECQSSNLRNNEYVNINENSFKLLSSEDVLHY